MSSLSIALDTTRRTVIVGGGIHGISAAYFLSLKGEKCLIVEGIGLASAASSKAGGFLAREWGSGPTVQLHEKSFDLHEELAKKLDIKSFRRIPTLQVSQRKKGNNAPSWLDGKCASSELDGACAQVTPDEYCEKVFNAAVATGNVELLISKCSGIEIDEDGVVKGIVVENDEGKKDFINGDKFLITAGPWAGWISEDMFGTRLPMTGIKSTSIVYNQVEEVKEEPYALFCDEDNNGCHLEAYPRNDGTLYFCGLGGSDYIDNDQLRPSGAYDDPLKVKPNPQRVIAAQKSFASMSSIATRQTADISQACMRPCPPDALPVMGRLPRTSNAYISAGHNCWGILWGPISGLALSELIIEGDSKVIDLKKFDTGRFGVTTPNLNKAQRGRHKKDDPIGEQW